MINIAELLKDAPTGMKLYSPLFGEVEFAEVMDTDYVPIRVIKRGYGLRFDECGRYMGNEYSDSECLLFPSKEVRTWEGWKLPNEPVFKVNEWIILDKTYTIPIQVIEINQKEGLYRCKSIEGIYGNYNITRIDKDYHLWTIADASNGDVIHTPNNNLFIYKCKGRGIQIYDYCGLYYGKFEPESSSPNGVYNSCDGYVPATKEQCDLLFAKMKEAGYKWDSNKKELCKIVETQFKVGDWVVKKDGTPFYRGNYTEQITCIEDDKGLKCIWFSSGTWLHERDIRLWSITDAKDGDVLMTTSIRNCPFIYRKTTYNNDLAYYYAGIDGNGDFCEGCLKRTLTHFGPVADVIPATKEQRDLLFKKMREAGYEWDADKKELRKIQPHYDISNFKPFDKVLVRFCDGANWCCALFSHYCTRGNCHFVCSGGSVTQCIPFNDDTKHLLGTSDPCDERYINW